MTITLHRSHWQSDSLVRNGHAPTGKQVFRCRACGRQSRKHPTPNHYSQARREEILDAYQERSSLRGLTRTFGVSRTTLSKWIKKMLPSFLLEARRSSIPLQTRPEVRSWNSMTAGPLCSKKRTRSGCG